MKGVVPWVPGEELSSYLTLEKVSTFINYFTEAHRIRCGENCVHTQLFYQKIGYNPASKNRIKFEMKKPFFTENNADNFESRSKLPDLNLKSSVLVLKK
jgi:hypothetical protein